MYHLKKILVITITAFMAISVHAGVIEIQCPAKIDTTEKLTKLSADFESMVTDATHYWTGVTFFSGHPKENASLAPDDASGWSFSKDDTIYIGCSYNQSSQMLFKKLPKHIRSCEVVYDKTVQGIAGQPGAPQKILCKE